MKILTVVALLLGACALAVAKQVPFARHVPSAKQVTSEKRALPANRVPLPRPKLAALDPASLRPGNEDRPGFDAVAEPSACALRLQEIARFATLPGKDSPGECRIGNVVRLDQVVMPDGSLVALNPAATLACSMAEAVAEWLRSDLALAAAELDAPPVAITTLASYDCRGRNGIAGAKLSEHARGNALDIGAIKLANGAAVDLTNRAASKLFRQSVRAAACERFTTVLGPGSDRYHESHIHLDLAERKGGHRLCQWDVGETVADAPAPELSSVTRAKARSRRHQSGS